MKISCVVIVVVQISLGYSFICSAPFLDVLCPDPSEIKYYLYTENTTTYAEIYSELLSGVQHKPKCPFVFIAHGWLKNGFDPLVIKMVKAFLINSCFNIIVVDWSLINSVTTLRTAINIFYPYPAYRTCCSGEYVGQFMIDLNLQLKVPYAAMHLVGHSFGAHLAGCAGQLVMSNTGQQVGRISGLDPAGIMFNDINTNCRLSPDDAVFVDCIHTDMNFLGYKKPLGHVDFYPNGGDDQPGCFSVSITSITCNHIFSYKLFTASINSYEFKSNQCDTYLDYKCNKCSNNIQIVMGFNVDKTEPGTYYLDTKCCPPYALNGEPTQTDIYNFCGLLFRKFSF